MSLRERLRRRDSLPPVAMAEPSRYEATTLEGGFLGAAYELDDVLEVAISNAKVIKRPVIISEVGGCPVVVVDRTDTLQTARRRADRLFMRSRADGISGSATTVYVFPRYVGN